MKIKENTNKEASLRLEVSPSLISKWCKDGRLIVCKNKDTKRIYITEESILLLLKEKENGTLIKKAGRKMGSYKK